jgi:hypothetical protein
MRNTRPIHRRLAVLAAVATAGTALASAVSSPTVSAAGEADAALDWIAAELADNGGTLPFPPFDENPPPTDWGLTLDAVLALVAGGQGDAATVTLTTFEGSVDDYITGEAFGDPGSVYAGPVGKSLLTVALSGGDVNDFGGRDLEALSRASVASEGLHVGRFSDTSTFGNNSNGFGQALNIIGLSYTDGGAPASAVDFLLDQQCDNGGFRLFYDGGTPETTTAGCDDDAEADPDATGLALSALATVAPSDDTVAAVLAARAWLFAIQDEATGGWAGAAPTDYVNSGSTAIVVRGLDAVGATALAAEGRAFLVEQQLTAAERADDAGAVAYTTAAHDDAVANGLPEARDQWRRSTTQAALAFGLPEFGTGFATPLTIEPARVIDTRLAGSRLEAGATLELLVAGVGAVPADAAAVVLNVTAIGTGPGFVTVHACLATPPLASSVNVLAGSVRANAVISAVSADGKVCVTAGPSAVDLVVDVSGFFPAGSDYAAVAPTRLLDTRPGERTADGRHAGEGIVPAGATYALDVADRDPLHDDADAVVLNVTVIGTEAPGFVSVHPCLVPAPPTSSVNFTGPGVVANAVVSTLSDTGQVCLTASTAVHLVVDVTGSFPAAAGFGALAPARLLDTRPGQTTVDGAQVGAGPQTGGITLTLPVAGRGNVPTDPDSVVLNVTLVGSVTTGGSFATVHPCLATPPTASNVNLVGAGVVANATVAEVDAEGNVCITIGGNAVDVIVDVNGYFG